MHCLTRIAWIFAVSASISLTAGSALIKAAGNGDLKAIREALKAGESVDTVDSNGWTALLWAVYYRQYTAVEVLLEKDADANIQTTDSKKSYPRGTTALMVAANDCQGELASLLLKRGAKAELKDASEGTAEVYARKADCQDVLLALGIKAARTQALDKGLKEIQAGKDVNAVDEMGQTLLMLAATEGDSFTATELLNKGASVDFQTSRATKNAPKGTTALMLAAKGNASDVARLLLEHKANPRLKDETGATAEKYALAGDAWEVQDLLLDRSVLRKSYRRVALDSFEAGGEILAAYGDFLPMARDSALETMKACALFSGVEPLTVGKTYEEGTLLAKVEVSYLELPRMIGSPQCRFTLRLVDAKTGSLEREQGFDMTTGFWGSEMGTRKERFAQGVGVMIGEYIQLVTGLTPPFMEGVKLEEDHRPAVAFNFSMVDGAMLAIRPTYYWQWVEQVPTYFAFRTKEFSIKDLKNQRVAVWPVSRHLFDADVLKSAVKDSGTEEAFLKALSTKLSERILKVVAPGSVSAETVATLLQEDALKPWASAKRILPGSDAKLLSNIQVAQGFHAVADHPKLRGVRYLVLPTLLQGVRFMRQTSGSRFGPSPMGSAATTETRSSLSISVVDLDQSRVVWSGRYIATTSSALMQITALHENEDALLDALIKTITEGEEETTRSH